MQYKALSRRHLLQGAGGFALAVPFMPSLMNAAHAQSIAKPKVLVLMAHTHGGVSAENVFPINATGGADLATLPLYAAMNGAPKHYMRAGELVALKRTHAQTTAVRSQAIEDFDAGAARVSPLVGSFVPDALLSKMNLLCGLDVMCGSGHWAGIFGNFGNAFGAPPNPQYGRSARQVPTIDDVIARSPKFYSDAERLLVKAPSVAYSGTAGGGWGLSFVKSGADVGPNPYAATRLGQLHDRLFAGVSAQPGKSDPDGPLVDVLYEDYRRLARGAFGPGRRLGKDDRVRLEAHMGNLDEIGRKLKAITTAACAVPAQTSAERSRFIRNGDTSWDWTDSRLDTPEAQVADVAASSALFNQMMVQAFLCGTTRVLVRSVGSIASPLPGYSDYHQDLYHGHWRPSAQQDLVRSLRTSFQSAFVDLIAKMNAAEVLPGVNLLDQSLVYWTAECGVGTHDAIPTPPSRRGAPAASSRRASTSTTATLWWTRRLGTRRAASRRRNARPCPATTNSTTPSSTTPTSPMPHGSSSPTAGTRRPATATRASSTTTTATRGTWWRT